MGIYPLKQPIQKKLKLPGMNIDNKLNFEYEFYINTNQYVRLFKF